MALAIFSQEMLCTEELGNIHYTQFHGLVTYESGYLLPTWSYLCLLIHKDDHSVWKLKKSWTPYINITIIININININIPGLDIVSTPS